MRHHAGLVVCDTAPIDPLTPLGGLERRAIPFAVLPRRLDVVMGVEQDGRGPRRPSQGADHGRAAAFADDGHLHPFCHEEISNRLRTVLNMALVEGIERHRRDAGQDL